VRICMVDGQGGGIGVALSRRLKEVNREEHEVVALGTNEVATAQMMKTRANRGASGENAIIRTVPTADLILGGISLGGHFREKEADGNFILKMIIN